MASFFEKFLDRVLPSPASVHYFLAKTHYQFAIHSANYGSEYWFAKAKEGFDAHADALQEIHRTTRKPSDRRLDAWTHRSQNLAEGLKQAEKAAETIRQLLLKKQAGNAEKTNEIIKEQQDLLRQLHRRLRRPDLR